jgi:hypothetical protein
MAYVRLQVFRSLRMTRVKRQSSDRRVAVGFFDSNEINGFGECGYVVLSI